MSEKTFTVAGVSRLDGEVKVRFANDTGRVKVLEKNGHEDVILIELSSPMTKIEAAKFIKTVDLFDYPAAQLAIDDFLANEEAKALPKEPKRAGRKPKVEVKPAVTDGVDIQSAATESSDLETDQVQEFDPVNSQVIEDDEAPF